MARVETQCFQKVTWCLFLFLSENIRKFLNQIEYVNTLSLDLEKEYF